MMPGIVDARHRYFKLYSPQVFHRSFKSLFYIVKPDRFFDYKQERERMKERERETNIFFFPLSCAPLSKLQLSPCTSYPIRFPTEFYSLLPDVIIAAIVVSYSPNKTSEIEHAQCSGNNNCYRFIFVLFLLFTTELIVMRCVTDDTRENGNFRSGSDRMRERNCERRKEITSRH